MEMPEAVLYFNVPGTFCRHGRVFSMRVSFDAAVDPDALNIPHYRIFIANPMDFGTIKVGFCAARMGVSHCLSSCRFADASRSRPLHRHRCVVVCRLHMHNACLLTRALPCADHFIADVRLVFRNVYTFNSPDHEVVVFAKKVETAFEAAIRDPSKIRASLKKSGTRSALAASGSTRTPATKKRRPAADSDDDDVEPDDSLGFGTVRVTSCVCDDGDDADFFA